MSRMVTPENPLRANAIRAASRIASRVRSDFRWPGAGVSGTNAHRFRGDAFPGGIEVFSPGSHLLEACSLRRCEARRIHVLLVLPDLDISGQSAFRGRQPVGKVTGLIVDPVTGEDVGCGVINRCSADG